MRWVTTGFLHPPVPAEDPEALGVLTHICTIGTFVQRMDPSLDHASADLGVELQLFDQ